jgi:hypothetical protein
MNIDAAFAVCDGGGPLGHPMVYLHTGSAGKAECPYCSCVFVSSTRLATASEETVSCEVTPGKVVESVRHTPDIDSVHRDLAFANQYRLELIKHLMTLAAGLLAFTVAFRPTLKPVSQGWLMWTGWIGLGLSMIGGLLHMLGWDRFYTTYLDYDFRGQHTQGVSKRRTIKHWRRFGMIIQFIGFGVGVLAIGLFAALNLGNVVVKP